MKKKETRRHDHEEEDGAKRKEACEKTRLKRGRLWKIKIEGRGSNRHGTGKERTH